MVNQLDVNVTINMPACTILYIQPCKITSNFQELRNIFPLLTEWHYWSILPPHPPLPGISKPDGGQTLQLISGSVQVECALCHPIAWASWLKKKHENTKN